MTADTVIPDLPAAVAYLFASYGKTVDDLVGLTYEHQLADVPLPLVREAVIAAPKRLPKQFVPGINEIRTLCETIRRERAAGIPFVPCASCRDLQPGWDTVVDPDGAKRLTRCGCWTRHREELAAIVGAKPIALLETGDEGDYRQRQTGDSNV